MLAYSFIVFRCPSYTPILNPFVSKEKSSTDQHSIRKHGEWCASSRIDPSPRDTLSRILAWFGLPFRFTNFVISSCRKSQVNDAGNSNCNNSRPVNNLEKCWLGNRIFPSCHLIVSNKPSPYRTALLEAVNT